MQKVPSLLDIIHKLIFEQKASKEGHKQFILTGSSARKLKRGGAKLLAGRAFVFHLYPLLYREIGEEFNLEKAPNWGTLPEIHGFDNDAQRKEYLTAYAATYLREEILQKQLIRKIELFQRFLPIAAQCSGTQLNFSKIGREVGVSKQTTQSYFHILEDTPVGFYLPAYHPSVRRQEQQSPKFYLFDQGVTKALQRHLDIPTKQGSYAYGKVFESFLIQQIKSKFSYSRRDDNLHYYRTKAGLEIDLIIEHPAKKT